MVMPKMDASQLYPSASATVHDHGQQQMKRHEQYQPNLASVTENNETKQEPSYDNRCEATASDEPKTSCVDSFDHVTFWVGNARQSAVFYMTQLGFEPLAFKGLETGSRDVACHVLKLNETIIQLVSPVEPNNRELSEFVASHGDAVKDVAFRVDNIEQMLKRALDNGAELVKPLEVLTFNDDDHDSRKTNSGGQGADESSSPLGKFVMKRATIKTFGDITHTFIERNYDYEMARFLPGYRKPSLEVSSCSGQDLLRRLASCTLARTIAAASSRS